MQAIFDTLFPQFAEADRVAQDSTSATTIISTAADVFRPKITSYSKIGTFHEITVELAPVGSLNIQSKANCAPVLTHPIIRTSSKMSIFTLKKFVHSKLGAPVDQIRIFCNEIEVGSEHNLHFLRKTMWFDDNCDMILHYQIAM